MFSTFPVKGRIDMTGKIRNYYATGHTARGFYNFFDSVLEGLDRVYILRGNLGTGMSAFIRKMGENMSSRGFNLELIHSPSDNDSLEGVIVTDLKVGIVDGTAPNVIVSQAPGVIEKDVHLGVTWNARQLYTRKETIKDLNRKIKTCVQKVYDAFSEALLIHDDELEQLYFTHLDIAKADDLTQRLINEFFQDATFANHGTVRHMFLGAATPHGPINHIPSLTANVGRRYFIKGPPGCGKSHMMKKITTEAEKRGIDMEVYHCSFDPHSLDMVLLPELDIAIFDSTDPHEHFPDRNSDITIDVYTEAITPGAEDAHAEEIKAIHGRYKSRMKEGIAHLAQAKTLYDELETIYKEAMDFDQLEQIYRDIEDQIETLIESCEEDGGGK